MAKGQQRSKKEKKKPKQNKPKKGVATASQTTEIFRKTALEKERRSGKS